MVDSINTSGIKVGTDGKVKVSGLTSGIDFKAIIDSQITAKRQPAVRLETRITTNNKLVSEYGVLKTKLSGVVSSLDQLRAAPGSDTNIFLRKVASGTTAPISGAPSGHVPSDINSLVLTSISNTAQAATHTLRIKQLAQAHQIRADAFSSASSALSGLGVTAGDFTVNGETITVSSTDTLQDLRAKINASGAGVTATIVSASPTSNFLVLNANESGADNEIVLGGTAAVTDSLGLTAAGNIKNELIQARNARFDLNGITDIERSSNEVDDVLTGVTFSLLKAETNTDVTLKIQPDLAAIKTVIGDFVAAYNGVRDYFNEQRTASDRNNDGRIDDGEFGPLATSNVLREAVAKLGELVVTNIGTNDDGFESLGQIGIVTGADFKLQVDDSILDSKLLTNSDQVRKLFGLDYTTSDSRLTLLGRGQATTAGTYYVNIAGTDSSGNVTSANIKATAGSGTGGASDGTVTVSNKTLTVNSTSAANGLQVFFNGAGSLGAVNDIEVTVSRGIGDLFYDYFNDLNKATSGQVDTLVSQLQTQNLDFQNRIDTIDVRLELVRANLEAQFTRMETALAALENTQNSITSYFDAQNNSGN
ncbi:MAG: hypothetical protein EBR79_00715 [Proteobacteria bacterium]|nr:hypothetical protein [Pseudomonadota bacterium]NBX86332.1 hypothetical protein [Pseudomonadota bacterium]